MKVFNNICVLFCSTIVFAIYPVREDLAEQWQTVIKPYEESCMVESGVSKEDAANCFIRAHYPNIPEFKSYLNCLQFKLNYLNRNGTVNQKNLVTTLKGVDLDIVEQSTEAVKNISDLNEKAYELVINGLSRISKRYPPRFTAK